MGPVNNSGYTENSYFEEMMSGGGANYFDIAGVDAFTRPVTEKNQPISYGAAKVQEQQTNMGCPDRCAR